MSETAEIGARLRLLREEKGKSDKDLRQSDVADALHVSRANYAKMESGERDLRTEYCVLLAEFYGVTCDYILRGVEAENVDFCRETGLSQLTIESLRGYEKDVYQRNDVGMPEHEYTDEMRLYAIRRSIINSLLQDRDFLDEVAYAADNSLYHNPNDLRKAANQYIAGNAFADFFKRTIKGTPLKESVYNAQDDREW